MSMKKKAIKLLLTFGASLLTLIAATVSAGACWAYYYQPEEPKSLRK